MSSSQAALFLRTKLRVMRPAHGTIARPRLDALRDAALDMRLVTLTAPGGFGKSTLAALWVAHWQAQGHHCTWLTLSPDEDEPARFLFSLVQALQRLGQGVGDAAQSLLQARALAAPRAVVSLLLNDLEALDAEAVVVLDDGQCLSHPEILDALAFFISHAPPHLHVLITARVLPPLALARLRAHGQWLDIDVASLRFDEQETQRFLSSSCPAALTPEQMSRLHTGTEGWPAALRLVALGHSLNGGFDPDVRGGSAVFATLLEELLESLPAPTVHFMAQTAVLERLHPDLCNAMRGAADSAAHIDTLLRCHILMAPMDGEAPWLRYHQLLRDHLLTRVAPRLEVDAALLHGRAAQWLAQQGLWLDAVRHALQAGDTQQAVQWLAHCGKSLVTSGDLLVLLSWRRQLPPELLATQPQVQLAVAWGLALAMRLQEALPLLDGIEQSAQQTLAPHERRGTLGECLAIRAVNLALQDDSLQAGALARRWQEEFADTGDTFTRNAVSNVLRFVHWKGGDLVQVYAQPWLTAPAGQEAHNAFSTVYRHTLLGGIELQKARLGLAERHAREALRCAREFGGAHSVSSALAAPLMAMVLYQQGHGAQAVQLLEPLLALIDATAMLESVLQAYQVLVGQARHDGNPALAFEYLERAEAIGYNRGWDRLVGAMLLERLRLLLDESRLDEASAVTIRLQRLAAHLPTELPSARSELVFMRDLAQARLALADQRIAQARAALAVLLRGAQGAAQQLRALQIGLNLAVAHMAAGDAQACFAQLRASLAEARSSGASGSVFDEGEEVRALLGRFLVSPECDPELAGHVDSLLGSGLQPQPAEAAQLLTERETRVLALVARGQSNKEVARSLGISAETVKTHLRSIFEKLGVQQRAQAVVMARVQGLLPADALEASL